MQLLRRINNAAVVVVLVAAGAAVVQTFDKSWADDKEPTAVVEVGGAGDWDLSKGGSSFGPSVAVEFNIIKDWIEIEAGVAPMFARNRLRYLIRSNS